MLVFSKLLCNFSNKITDSKKKRTKSLLGFIISAPDAYAKPSKTSHIKHRVRYFLKRKTFSPETNHKN